MTGVGVGAATVYRLLGDVVMVVHLAFIVFVAVGGLLAWRWRWLIRLHVPAVAWAVATITVGLTCPLTVLEKRLQRLGGEDVYAGGFVDRYIEDVVYPQSLTFALRLLVAAAIVVAYARLLAGGRDQPARAPSAATCSGMPST